MADDPASFDYGKVADELYDQWEKGMTTWWDQVLDNPAFLGMLGQNLTTTSQVRRAYQEAMDKGLESAHLPTRADLIRVARVVSLLEDKLLSVEDQVFALQDKLAAIEKEALKARLHAAETRLELTEHLSRIEAKLDALTAPATDAPAKKKQASSTRKSTRKSASTRAASKKGASNKDDDGGAA